MGFLTVNLRRGQHTAGLMGYHLLWSAVMWQHVRKLLTLCRGSLVRLSKKHEDGTMLYVWMLQKRKNESVKPPVTVSIVRQKLLPGLYSSVKAITLVISAIRNQSSIQKFIYCSCSAGQTTTFPADAVNVRIFSPSATFTVWVVTESVMLHVPLCRPAR